MTKSFPLPARIKRWTLLSMLPVFALSACKTVETNLSAPACFSRFVTASGLAADVEHAALPSPTVGGWVAYGNSEGGQLDIANARNRAVVGIGQECDRMAAEAERRVEKKPWYRKVL